MRKILIFSCLVVCTACLSFAQDADEKYATELLKPGTEAPEFTLKTADGTEVSLSDFKGKTVVLDFWASWCPDCRKDIPEMKRLHEAYGDKVAFVSVSFDTDKERWTKCISDNKMAWTHVSPLAKWKETDVSKAYHVNWIPSMYIIDAEGRVVLGTVMIEKLEKEIEGK
ncbi:MAG: TlpA family protein disulfide reductase [Prevotella sp.]|nr:TlpA family protein disulfide reductase [Prevotella sp.]